jgi:hypothetical protein
MKTPEDFTQVEQENPILLEHLRTLYDTRTQDEQALQAIETRLAASSWPNPQERIPGPSRKELPHMPKQAGFPLSLRPAARAFTLLAATLVVVLLAGSFAVLAMALHHPASSTGAPSVHTSGTPLAQTPQPQASAGPQFTVSGTILEVHLDQSASEGALVVQGPKEQYHGSLGEEFAVSITKETKLFKQLQQGRQPIPLTRLQVGQRVQIQFNGGVFDTAPASIWAEQLVIIADGGSGS